MPPASYDVAIIGVGGMGSAIAAHAARRGLSVLGLEQFSIPNTRGSSHGVTRILRLGLHEGPTYVPLVLRAAELWRELGQHIGTPVFQATGGLDVGMPESSVVQGSRRACLKFDLPHEILDADEVRQRFPALSPARGMMAVYQPGSGFILPELAISAHVDMALDQGAHIHGHERLIDWEPKGRQYLLRTDRATYQAGQVVFATGAWLGKLLNRDKVPVVPERTILGWFAPRKNRDAFRADRLPIWIVDAPVSGHFYGFPFHGTPGFKLGRLREIPSSAVDPDLRRKEPDAEDEADMRTFLREIFPDADGPILAMESCFFENTPDRTPIIDRLPGEKGAWVVGGFSGHGFKFCSAVGELTTRLMTGETPGYELAPFQLKRFAATS